MHHHRGRCTLPSDPSLLSLMEHWPAESIWEQVAPLLPGFTVEVLPEIDSTNTELMRRARAGQAQPILLAAEHQTAGRGRLGGQRRREPRLPGARQRRPVAGAAARGGRLRRQALTISRH